MKKTRLLSFRIWFLFLFIQFGNPAFSQEFRIDSLLLERKICAFNDSLNLSVVKKVFVKSEHVAHDFYGVNKSSEYAIESEYWLFWNNNNDSLLFAKDCDIQMDYSAITFRKLQNNINAVLLKYSKNTHSIGLRDDTERILQMLNLDDRSSLLYTRLGGQNTQPNGGAHSDFRHDIDTYYQEYSLSFEADDTIKLTHSRHEVYRGSNHKVEQLKTLPEQVYVLKFENGKYSYKKEYGKPQK